MFYVYMPQKCYLAFFGEDRLATLLCSLARFDLANRCAPANPAAHLCSTARTRRDIRAASFCSCKLLWRSDECVLLPFFNTQPNFCSYELLCRSIEFIFLQYPNLERWWFILSAMTHKIRGERVEEYAYYGNKLR